MAKTGVCCCCNPVVDHITKVFAVALIDAQSSEQTGTTEVRFRRLSEVEKLPMRESTSLAVSKSIYERQAWPARSGGLEKAFIEWAQADSSIEAFCKISETRHDFARLRYVKEDGLPSHYSPDFLVREPEAVYLVETKAQGQLSSPNVQRKLRAATAWCERINALAPNKVVLYLQEKEMETVIDVLGAVIVFYFMVKAVSRD